MKFRNKKTKEIYQHVGHCIDATNGENDKLMILYKNKYGDLFVRESKEFNEKFESVEK